jgi:hypothetical protein
MNPEGKLKVQRVIWGALLAAQVVYCGGVFLLLDETSVRTDSPEMLNPIRFILAGAALGALALAAVMPKLMLRSAITRRQAADPRPPSPAEMAEMSLVPSLIRWVLLETVTLNGFVLAMIQRDPRQILPFFAVAFVALAMSYPSERAIRQPFAEVYGS